MLGVPWTKKYIETTHVHAMHTNADRFICISQQRLENVRARNVYHHRQSRVLKFLFALCTIWYIYITSENNGKIRATSRIGVIQVSKGKKDKSREKERDIIGVVGQNIFLVFLPN
jgi:hypothetical protein